jgi:pyruvate dehydrogenase E1 component
MTDQINDKDPVETEEWLAAIESVLRVEGPDRAAYLLDTMAKSARAQGAKVSPHSMLGLSNSIDQADEPDYPGDLAIETEIDKIIRWNAVMMVIRATKYDPELGGHLSTFASAATLYHVGQLHFFKAKGHEAGQDLVFFQGHASPGMYSQAFLEGRLSEDQIGHFRQEVAHNGVTSYPHPWLMRGFWEFPTVSMGLAPYQAVFQARFLKYLDNRELQNTAARKVWAFCGDGEMDEPESTGCLNIAGRDHLDNLIFVVNCNLQKLDGLVRSNSSVMRELESLFLGAGWHVIKVMWGGLWDDVLARDTDGLLAKRMAACVDGEYQNFAVHDGAYIREHFFGTSPELLALVKDLSDDDLKAMHLNRGGHDIQKVYAAFHEADNNTSGKPVCILPFTIKGYGIADEMAQNTTHNAKKLDVDQVKQVRDFFKVDMTDKAAEKMSFIKPKKTSPEMQYVLEHRKRLGGFIPERREKSKSLKVMGLEAFESQLKGTDGREISSTMALVRMINIIMKDKTLGQFVMPVVPDESRTIGIEGMYRQYGIYNPLGQLYDPVDKKQLMYYREAKNGQFIEEGLNEAGAFCTWMAAAVSYATNDLPMIPCFIYYSMFGFQRFGDFAWAAGDMRCRGFMFGVISGRTTLAGEGLQHQDGHNHVLANTIPNCVSYDPCYAYEVAVIIQDGLRRMVQDCENVYYYVTLCNETYAHPAMPKGVEADILKGLYLLHETKGHQVQLIGSGTILREVEAAADLLEKDFGVKANVWSATSFNLLGRELHDVERWNRLHPDKKPKTSYVEDCFASQKGPVVAATDSIKIYADQIRKAIKKSYYVLGTDGFGRSDTREALRAHFEVDRYHVVVAALKALQDEGKLKATVVKKAIKQYGIDSDKINPIDA